MISYTATEHMGNMSVGGLHYDICIFLWVSHHVWYPIQTTINRKIQISKVVLQCDAGNDKRTFNVAIKINICCMEIGIVRWLLFWCCCEMVHFYKEV